MSTISAHKDISSQFKALKKQIDFLIADLEREAILDGYDIDSKEFKNLVVLVKTKVLDKQGITINEYEEVEASLERENPSSFSDLLNILNPPPFPKIPTQEEIRELAMSVLPAPQIIYDTKVVKETTREIPITKVIKTTEVIREIDSEALDELKKDILSLQSAFTDLAGKEDDRDVHGELGEMRQELDRLIRTVKSYPGTGGFLGIRLDGEGTMQSYAEFKAGSNVTLTRSGKVITVAAAAGAGAAKETPTGTVNGSNVTFIPTGEPDRVISDGVTYYDGLGYTWGGADITMDIPPSLYIRAYV